MATHDDIAAALTSIYDFLIQIGYVEETDVSRPPHNPPVAVKACKEAGLTD